MKFKFKIRIKVAVNADTQKEAHEEMIKRINESSGARASSETGFSDVAFIPESIKVLEVIRR